MDHQEPEQALRNGQYQLVIAGWVLEEERHCLQRNAETKKLEPRTIQLLGYMARHAGEPLSREILLREVWQGVVVNDDALTTSTAPVERVVVFDEAQRAWTRKQVSGFMKTKRGLPSFGMSEPQFLLSVMDRHADWCAVVVWTVMGRDGLRFGHCREASRSWL